MQFDDAAQPAISEPSNHAVTVVIEKPVYRLRRLFSQFAILSLAEIICRLISLLVVVQLARRVGREGYGRVEFSFNVVYWLIFVLRDGVELVFCREVARRTRLKPSLINSFLSLKLSLSIILWSLLCVAATFIFKVPSDRMLVCSYGALLLTTALGLDNVFRGREKPEIVAVSLIIRSSLYALGIWYIVTDAGHLFWVPWILFLSEATGISLVWFCYSLEFGLPRLRFRHAWRFATAVLAQGRCVLGIQLAQVILASIDVVIIGLSDSWGMVGLYGAPHRIITAAVTFGLIFQQVLLPHLVRSGTLTQANASASIRRISRLALTGLIPITLLISITGRLVIDTLFTVEFDSAWPLLMIGVWRVPLLAVTSIHIATMVALHREREGLRIMSRCVMLAIPVVLLMHSWRGLLGTACAMVFVALMIAIMTGLAVYDTPHVTSQNSTLDWSEKPRRRRFRRSVATIAGAFLLLVGLLWQFDGLSQATQVNRIRAGNGRISKSGSKSKAAVSKVVAPAQSAAEASQALRKSGLLR